MIAGFARRIFGSQNERRLKPMFRQIEAINALEPHYQEMTDEELRDQTRKLKERLAAGETLDDILNDAFAVVREGAKRTLGQRHFDVQLVGGMVLHSGAIAEMKTGEGKTLVATLAVYLNALAGKGVHVVTVNDYLAKRDAEWMGQIYRFLGLSVGVILHNLTDEERRAAYACDVTYGTNNELGFDYLRDNMKFSLDTMVQRGHAYAIVDEVDSILIDEARTPLIISGPTEDQSELYRLLDTFIPKLVPPKKSNLDKDANEEDRGDYDLDEKQRQVSLTEAGNEHIENLLRDAGLLKGESLYDIDNVTVVHHVNQALRAHKLFARDRDYIVKDDKVVIIDEFTGRMMEGRRYSEGLHQALEAKEHVEIQPENVTLASITFQNYFRLYTKLAGMTGTAATEAPEFADIYKLEVHEIPTNVPVARIDSDDEVYRTIDEKYKAIIDLIEECEKRGQPMLVGTTSIEKSEVLHELLKKRKVKHNVLNARYHEQEAHIVAQAGRYGAVTIATNMAGRGTDIQLGGNFQFRVLDELGPDATRETHGAEIERIKAEVEDEKKRVLEAGGLYVVGTERHESRRIDNQLRGRSGRQGDPGASKFFLSIQDDLMRIFGSDRMDGLLQKLGLQEGEAITHPWINKALEKAQQKVEAQHFDARKNILKYDDVMNDQRKAMFEQRRDIMESSDLSETIADMRHEVVDDLVSRHIPERAYAEQWNASELHEEVKTIFALDLPIGDWAREEGIAEDEIKHRILDAVDQRAAKKAADISPEIMRQVEKGLLLQTLDHNWREHIVVLDHLRQVIGLRGYGQRDPLNEYKTEAFSLFEILLSRLRTETTRALMHIEIELQREPQIEQPELPRMAAHKLDPTTGRDEMAEEPDRRSPRSSKPAAVIDRRNPATWGKTPRNAPCPCGSGKKFKHCHGALSVSA